MSQRLRNVLLCVLVAVAITGLVVLFQYYPFHWWLLIGPALATPLIIVQQRRQQHWDEVRSRRERGEDHPAN